MSGVLLASVEGGFADSMAEQILAGRRRPRGHLLPQSLAVHAGLDAALKLRVLRVQRIAVAPLQRRRGTGHALLNALAAWGEGQGFDLLGCAYGAELGLLDFWCAAGLRAVRLGARVDPASAAHSLFMLRGLSGPGQALAVHGQRRFQRQLPWALAGSLCRLDGDLAAALLGGRDCADVALDEFERRDLARVAAGARQAVTAELPIWKALLHLAACRSVDRAQLAPLVAWQLQHRPAEQVCREYAIAGRRDLAARLRSVLAAHDAALPCAS